MSQSLTERYDERIAGILSCYDRLVGDVPASVETFLAALPALSR
jgi:hypothetical protein